MHFTGTEDKGLHPCGADGSIWKHKCFSTIEPFEIRLLIEVY